MSEMEEALYTRLSGYAGLTALVQQRIYERGEVSDRVEDPYVTFERISTPRESAMGSDLGLAHPRFQVTCWGASTVVVKPIAVQIRAALRRWNGTVSSVVVQDTYLADERSLYDPETKLRGVAIDAIIWHQES